MIQFKINKRETKKFLEIIQKTIRITSFKWTNSKEEKDFEKNYVNAEIVIEEKDEKSEMLGRLLLAYEALQTQKSLNPDKFDTSQKCVGFIANFIYGD